MCVVHFSLLNMSGTWLANWQRVFGNYGFVGGWDGRYQHHWWWDSHVVAKLMPDLMIVMQYPRPCFAKSCHVWVNWIWSMIWFDPVAYCPFFRFEGLTCQSFCCFSCNWCDVFCLQIFPCAATWWYTTMSTIVLVGCSQIAESLSRPRPSLLFEERGSRETGNQKPSQGRTEPCLQFHLQGAEKLEMGGFCKRIFDQSKLVYTCSRCG